jgi:diadenosine tetraphosphate (Ap4A) HIT family hydrolase
MNRTLFDEIVDGTVKSWKIWEDADYLAFLTPFPNTSGVTVVIPKQNPGDYLFDLDDPVITGLVLAAKKVAKLLEAGLNVKRVAMVFEGTGVAHVHTKLYPLHGDLASQTNVWSSHTEFYNEYIGYITTIEGAKAPDQELDALQQKIIGANQ